MYLSSYMRGLPGRESCWTRLPTAPSRLWWDRGCGGGGAATASVVGPCPARVFRLGARVSLLLTWITARFWRGFSGAGYRVLQQIRFNMLLDRKVMMDSLKLLDAADLLQAVAVVVVTTVGRWPVLVLRPVRARAQAVAPIRQTT